MSRQQQRWSSFAVVSALVGVVLALAGCQTSSPGGSDQPGTGPTVTIGSQSPSGTTTPAATGTPGPSPAGPVFPTTAESYAKATVAAWAGGDTVRLNQLEVPTGQLHTALSCHTCFDTHFAFIHCQGAAGTTYCLFYNQAGDELTLALHNALLGQPHAVIAGGAFVPIIFPSDDKAYAQEALDAWVGRNDARLKLLTQSGMACAQVDALGADPNLPWGFDHSEGTAGSVYFSWHDPAGHKLAFQFVNGPAAPSTGAASHHRVVGITYLPS